MQENTTPRQSKWDAGPHWLTRLCEHCGEPFTRHATEFRFGRRYCSLKCAQRASIGRPQIETEEHLHARFWSRVDRSDPDGCWPWIGGLVPGGYGSFSYKNRTITAHRMAWILTNGPIPEGMEVCHTCDAKYPPGDVTYRRCCRPTHAFLGTSQENTADKTAKGRTFKPKGSVHPMARWTDEQIIEMRRLFDSGVPLATLRGQFPMSKTNLRRIVLRQTWRHVLSPPPIVGC